jgi:hypothetical protein
MQSYALRPTSVIRCGEMDARKRALDDSSRPRHPSRQACASLHCCRPPRSASTARHGARWHAPAGTASVALQGGQDFAATPARISLAITAPSEFGAILISASSLTLASAGRPWAMSRRAAAMSSGRPRAAWAEPNTCQSRQFLGNCLRPSRRMATAWSCWPWPVLALARIQR